MDRFEAGSAGASRESMPEPPAASMSEETWPLRLIDEPNGAPGYTHGHRYPCLIAMVSIAPSSPDEWLPQVERLLSHAVGRSRGEPDRQSQRPGRSPAVTALLDWTSRIQNASGVPVLERGTVVFEDAKWANLRIPSLVSSHKLHVMLVTALVKLFGLVANGESTEPHLREIGSIMDALRQHWQHAGGNVPRLLNAAFAMQIPFKELPGNVIQYGYGSRAHWMDSSTTDMTSRIGTVLARSKDVAAAMLRQAGVPVAKHMRVESGEAALAAAERLGYPVVVKPADKDGGVAVAAGLTTPDQVRRAFARAVEESPNVLVEKYFEGRDFRLTVHRSELIWAAERIPGGVVGDGENSVAGLIEMKARRDVGSFGRRDKYALALDEEALEFLGRAGLAPDSVPTKDQAVRLRGAANLARGATVAPALHLVHPDNRALAVRAADTLRLDLAGIDLLIGDIGKSWREIGAVVCEVNAQPDLGISGPHIYGEILGRLVGDGSRIPIAVVLGDAEDGALVSDIARSLAGAGRIVGVVDAAGVHVGGRTVTGEPRSAFAASQILMLDRTVEAAVVAVNDGSLLRAGLAFDRFDVLVVAGTRITGPSSGSAQNALVSLLKALLPMCTGTVLTVEGSGVRLTPPFENCPATFEDGPVPARLVGQAVADRMTKAYPKQA